MPVKYYIGLTQTNGHLGRLSSIDPVHWGYYPPDYLYFATERAAQDVLDNLKMNDPILKKEDAFIGELDIP